MNKSLIKKIITWVIIAVITILVLFGGYKTYQYIMANLFSGIASGVSKGVADTVNPFK
jgi:uncharacterized membrane protein